jgi:hypothetical protein
MTQQEAIDRLAVILQHSISREHSNRCTGDAETCPIDECMICGVRDCPGNEPLHYHHDGCPYCDNPTQPISQKGE